jgi:hypothetical protein
MRAAADDPADAQAGQTYAFESPLVTMTRSDRPQMVAVSQPSRSAPR